MLTTHSMEEAETLSNRLAIMTKGGHLAVEGTTLQIKNEHGKKFIIDLTFKSDSYLDQSEADKVDYLVPLKHQINKKVVWNRDEVIQLLQDKDESHLAMQVNTKGILCPDSLKGELPQISAIDLWAWLYPHQ